ncbi:MAG: hypothetical protein ACLR8Y_18930 [Alistipes indistinctus]
MRSAILGQNDETGSSYYGASRLGVERVAKRDEFNRIQRKLIRFGFSFRLTKAPDRTGTHRFTITYTNEDGVELTRNDRADYGACADSAVKERPSRVDTDDKGGDGAMPVPALLSISTAFQRVGGCVREFP